ncbi:MAG TPA: DinB family protein [Haliangiales bacterium]|nr:DinB family protein [Haliangiales bacterium]
MPLAGLLASLERTPLLVFDAFTGVADAVLRRRLPSGGFALVEQIWHLADLEREGYGERLRRLLAETSPALPDFEGDRVAQERRYLELDPREGLLRFAEARAANLVLLAGLAPADLERAGVQEGVGPLTLGDVPRMMVDHDRGHLAEIAEILALYAPGHPALPRLRAGS